MTVSIGTLLIGGICLFLAGTFVGVGLCRLERKHNRLIRFDNSRLFRVRFGHGKGVRNL